MAAGLTRLGGSVRESRRLALRRVVAHPGHCPDTLPVPHIASRSRDADAACPRCGASVKVHEVATERVDRPDELTAWVVAKRYCTAGCVLLSSDFDTD